VSSSSASSIDLDDDDEPSSSKKTKLVKGKLNIVMYCYSMCNLYPEFLYTHSKQAEQEVRSRAHAREVWGKDAKKKRRAAN
jgi:hypothetical protein